MRIESVSIKNYRCFRGVELNNLPRMTIVVGANGSGKSTLLDVFAFIKDALAQDVAYAVARRGGYRELASREQPGPIEIELKLRRAKDSPLATYTLRIAQDGGDAVVERELLRYRNGAYGQPWHLVDFSRGQGSVAANESEYGDKDAAAEREEFALDAPNILAIKALGQFRKFPIISEFRKFIEAWRISDLRAAEAPSGAEAGHAKHLSPRGENLAQAAQYLRQNHPNEFNRVLRSMRRRIPGVSDIDAKSTEDGRLLLRFQDGGFKDPFIARSVSDGTIKMFAYLILLNDPAPHPLLIVEEPEIQLYPDILYELIEEFRIYAERGGQVFISTHSPEFLNWAKLDEIFWLVKQDGFATARRASGSELLNSLVAAGDLPGELWKQNLFEGASP